ncbi:MAG: helix-turn-helix domain-containing protein [Chloroflexota bacterium]|nr:XRE family transcriptional regulator [Chloroflexia bacterium]MDQ3227237.1 helix-turn-helix domain-containing protein [Chloroflexota bacterium]
MIGEPASTSSSGNPFADLGMSDADTRLAKARIAQKITAIMRDRGLTQREVAKVLDISQPRVSEITRGQLKDVSLQRLMELVKSLDMDVEITVIPNPEPAQRSARLVVREMA